MKSFIYILAISFALMSFAYGLTPFLPCADGSPPPTSFDNKCSSILCNFTSGGSATGIFPFTARSRITSMKLRLTFVASPDFSTVHSHETEENACDGLLDAQCPIEAGQTVTYSLTQEVPSLGVDYLCLIEQRLVDQDGSTVFCIHHAGLVDEPTTK